MSKIVRAAVVAVLLAAPAFGAIAAPAGALADGIGWDQAPAAAAAAGVPAAPTVVVAPQGNGIGWD